MVSVLNKVILVGGLKHINRSFRVNSSESAKFGTDVAQVILKLFS